MREGPDIVGVAAAIGDPARGAMLTALLRIPLLAAGELAREAGVTAQTASGHLRQLCDAGLVECTAQGRHRYYGLAGARVAHLLEQLLGLAEHLGHGRSRPGPKDASLRRARTCYDHMAGSIAVDLFARMRDANFFEVRADELALTPFGDDALVRFGLTEASLRTAGTAACRSCLDWSERRPHLAGRAGAGILRRIIELQWVVRDGRLLRISGAGEIGLARLFLPAIG